MLAAMKGRINQIKTEIENTDSDFDREKLQERLAKLSGGVAVVKVGAATETEMKEKKHRVEDALQATRAALEEGIVPGGGVALLAAQKALNLDKYEDADEQTGAKIVRRALEEPLRQIADNAGLEGSVVVNDVRKAKKGQGLNAATGEIVDLVSAGIIDPAMVTRSALQNAASIAKNILTTEAIVAEVPEVGGGGGGGMPDMSGMMSAFGLVRDLVAVRQSQEGAKRQQIRTPPGNSPLAVDPLEIADHVHAEITTGRQRRGTHPRRVVWLALILDENVEASLRQQGLQPIVKGVPRRTWYLGPGRDQVVLSPGLPSHRHRKTPSESRYSD